MASLIRMGRKTVPAKIAGGKHLGSNRDETSKVFRIVVNPKGMKPKTMLERKPAKPTAEQKELVDTFVEITRLNKEKGLKLNAIPFVWLKQNGKKSTVLWPEIKKYISEDKLNHNQKRQYQESIEAQRKILEENGFNAYNNNFRAMAGKKGKIVAVLVPTEGIERTQKTKTE